MTDPGRKRKPQVTAENSIQFHATVAIQTHGCKLNQADSQDLAQRFVQAGYRVVGPTDPADVYVLNSCTVTHVADRKARQALRAASRENPSALVIATGCYAQRAPVELSKVAGVNLVVGNAEKEQLVELVLAARGDQIVPCAVGEEVPESLENSWSGRIRAMVKIQEGCNQVCTYCIVPKVRGRERSIPLEVLVRQIRGVVDQGCREVVLTGTQLGSYGFDLPGTGLRDLIALILDETEVERLRVSSLQPQEITRELLDLWDDPRLCPHFHIPLQSGSDYVLRQMHRRYTTAQYAEAVDRVRSRVPGASITADVIVGFPTEEDLHFRECTRFVGQMEFASIHVFPYSVRPGTSAAHLKPKVGEGTKRERMEEMLTIARKQASAFRHMSLGTTRRVLWEKSDFRDGRRVSLGLTDNYLKVHTDQDISLKNQITWARLVAESGEGFLAELV